MPLLWALHEALGNFLAPEFHFWFPFPSLVETRTMEWGDSNDLPLKAGGICQYLDQGGSGLRVHRHWPKDCHILCLAKRDGRVGVCLRIRRDLGATLWPKMAGLWCPKGPLVVNNTPKPPNHPTTQPPNHPTTQPPNHPTTQPPNYPSLL